MHSAKAEVETSAAAGISRARSYVTRRARIAPPSPRVIAAATSSHPSSSNIIAPDRITLPGFTLFCPAYLGAVPWVASNTAYPSPTLPPGASPSPPTWAAAASESRSPVRLGAAITEYSSGRNTSCANIASVIRSFMISFPVSPFVLGDRLVPEALLRELIPPLAEPALGEFHDVALVNERDRAATGAQRVLDGFGDQALGAELGHRLDADRTPGADLGAEPLGEEPDHRIGFGAAGPVLDSGVHVLDVLAEDHYVELLRLPHRAGHALEVAHRPDAGVQVQHLAQGDVEGSDPPSDGSGQRTLDGHAVRADGVQGGLGKPVPDLLEGFLSGQDL